MKRLFAMLLAVCMIFSLVACGGSDTTPNTNEPAKENANTATNTDPSTPAESGGTTEAAPQNEVGSAAPGAIATVSTKDTFTFAMLGEPISLDNSATADAATPTGWLYFSQLYDTLLLFDANEQEFYPRLANSWEYNDDATEITFELRTDGLFHCGAPVTAEDVVWSLNRTAASDFVSAMSGAIDHFEVVDDNHVKMVLKYAYAPALQVLTVPCWGIVCPTHAQEAEANGTDFGRNPCGSGAYKLVSWETGRQLSFDAAEGHWEGAPAIQHVNAVIVGDAAAGALALEQGTIDYHPSVATTDFEYLSTLDSVHTELLPGTAIITIYMNTQEGPFADVRVRQAVSMAVDRAEILMGGKDGYGSIANCYCSPVCTGYDAAFTATPQDLEKAKELLAEAGYPNGFSVECKQDSSPTYMPVAEVVQAQLRKIGIELEFNKMERTTWTDVVSVQKDYYITVRQSMFSVYDADYMLTRQFYSTSASNFTNYNNPDMDVLLDAARVETDPVKRNEMYTEAFTMIRDEAPVVPLLYNASLQAISADLMGMMDDFSWRDMWNRLYFI